MTLTGYFTWFKENWQNVSVIVAIFLTAYLVVIVLPQSMLLFAVLMSAPLYMLHEFEEYVIPGGFAQFMNHNIFKSNPESELLTAADVFGINMFVWIAIPLFSLWAISDISQAIALPYFYIFQAVIHLMLGIAGKRVFNPGMFTAWLLHVPWGIWTIWLLVQAGVITNPFWNAGFRDGLIIAGAMLVANRVLTARYKRRQYINKIKKLL